MSLSPDLQARIEAILNANPVVLFMKGSKQQPRCGFSAAALEAMNAVGAEFADVDVLADAEIREGIKAFGNWPTIPQLYVRGELVGGADIISEMSNSGELHRLLGKPMPDRRPPVLSISDRAAAAIRDGLDESEDDVLHLQIDSQYRARFVVMPAKGHEIVATANGITIHFDLASARRADGLEIDWAETVQGAGLVLNNPNRPQGVRAISVRDLQQMLSAGAIEVIDVRPAAARQMAQFPGPHRVLEGQLAAVLALPRDQPLAFLCHHGISSRSAAEHFVAQGFTKVMNVEGGIDAWSLEIDPSVPRY